MVDSLEMYLVVGGLDVHRSEDFNLHLHSGAISTYSRLPHARNSGELSLRIRVIITKTSAAVIHD